MEMIIDEPIADILELTGETLYGSSWEIKGILGFSTTILQGESTLYDVETQQFSIMLNTLDVEEYGIQEDDVFSIEDTVYIHTFRIINTPIPNMQGWSRCSVAWKGKISNV
jgi:hypothetical protein